MIRDRIASFLRGHPAFVEQGGNPFSRQPYVATNATILGWVLDAEVDALKDLIDRNLNTPRTGLQWRPSELAFGSFVPLMPAVCLVAADLPHLSSGSPGETDHGYTPETDFAFWVPVAFVRKAGPVQVVEWIGFFLPYLFVDEGWALSAGRESYGMPKLLSTNTFARTDDAPGVFAVDTQIIKTYAADAEAKVGRLLTMRRTDAPNRGPLHVSVKDEVELVERILIDAWMMQDAITLPGIGLGIELAECVLKTESQVVSLKQFRDATDGTAACYQAILSCPFQYTNYSGAGLMEGTWELEIHDVDSHPLLSDLGLHTRQQARSASWMQLDFTMMPGKTLWRA